MRRPFIKISTTSPSHLNAVKKVVETGVTLGRFPSRSYTTFESNMPIVLRFMVDAKITGMNWIELPTGSWSQRTLGDRLSTCQYELDVL